MTSASQEPDERARKNLSVLLRKLSSVGQSTAAAGLGVSEATISRMKSEGDLERFARLLALCGLKCVPLEMRCYPPDQVDWLLLGNRIAARKVRSASDLEEEDPE